VTGMMQLKVKNSNEFTDSESTLTRECLECSAVPPTSVSRHTTCVDRGGLRYASQLYYDFVCGLEARIAYYLTESNCIRLQDVLIPAIQEAVLGDKALRRAQFDLATRTASESSSGESSAAASSASTKQGVVAFMSADLCNQVFKFATLRYTRIRHLYTLRDILSEARGKGSRVETRARVRAQPKAKCEAAASKSSGDQLLNIYDLCNNPKIHVSASASSPAPVASAQRQGVHTARPPLLVLAACGI